jgi:signal transduction histidine kinase
MREVLMNLLSNAIKYNDHPVPRVEVGYFAPDEPGRPTDTPEEAREQAVFFVRDDGIGIEPRHQAQVWNLFKRLHVRDAYGGGTGAGLTIVKRLVERHRGRVWIDSRAGEGTTFFFSLPAQQGQWGAEP